MTTSNLYALILAGGVGTRLWPRSRSHKPKQLLALTGERSLLQMTVDRVRPLLPPERIFIMTNREYVDAIREQVPDIPADHIIGEPAMRGTAPAIGLGAVLIRRLDPDATMASLHADHYFADEEQFRRALIAATDVAQGKWLVNLGVRPTYPATGYGYVELAEELGTFNEHPAYRVLRFKEKPDLETARHFVASGRFLWNSGIFCWRVDTILEEFARHLPEHTAALERIAAAVGTPDAAEVLEREWLALPGETTIDHGIMEKAERVATVPMAAGWNDIGSWDSLAELLDHDEQGNHIEGDTLVIDGERIFVQSEGRFLALIGLSDVIVVNTPDATLICRAGRSQDVKHVVKWLKQHGRTDLL
ncbi:mannose-1-phosphate guanylyltransferase [Ardenticatena maritima]|uniref:mannose-1-phosphate guanylyltransferase n=2 Tax=Ardenticatena maritima TaxID=872965 RepID=A0A0P6YFS9_9CHLR|nr:mannose-1-phosphate guanylyltransferase [Ardenticatena maritima]KPL88363.1 hypothetical protein SE16_05970 [Ardenticatena maritima]